MKFFLTLISSIAVVFCSAQIPAYYNDVDLTLTGTELRDALTAKLQSSTYIPYTASGQFDAWDALRISDQNPENSQEVLLIYGWESGSDGNVTNDRSRNKFHNGNNVGDWNREHVFPRSRAVPALTVDDPGPGTDLHNLRPCDVQTNTLRNNLKFVAGTGNAGISSNGWYPGDEWKGDVARMVMYMYVRYNGDGSSTSETQCLPTETGFGTSTDMDPNMLNLFLDWNAEDPVSDIELVRNTVSMQHQNNRNPFIDNPAIATAIWGGPEAEDPWGLLEEEEEPGEFTFDLDAMVLTNGVILQWTPLPLSVGCQLQGGPEGGNDPLTETVPGSEVGSFFVPKSKLKAGRSYQWKVRCATGNNPVTGLTPFSDYHVFEF